MSEQILPDSLTAEKTEDALEQALRRGSEYSVDGFTQKSHNIRDIMAVRRELLAEQAAEKGNLLQRGFNPVPRRG
ncbi:hypothetical protein [Halodesulfovibrio sp.]|uniref:hypothetical protein n=1 Tax=Halodesulfovibrio sp. TaxID=1912772 RepID=UPI0025BC91A4|nr:hypothetical protein [Halodesulfovibrio sp.]